MNPLLIIFILAALLRTTYNFIRKDKIWYITYRQTDINTLTLRRKRVSAVLPKEAMQLARVHCYGFEMIQSIEEANIFVQVFR